MGVSPAHAILSPCCKHFFTMTSTPRVDSPSQRRDRWSIPASSLNHSAFNSISSQIWSHRLYGTSPAEEKPQDINKRTANESYILSGNTVIQERPRRRDTVACRALHLSDEYNCKSITLMMWKWSSEQGMGSLGDVTHKCLVSAKLAGAFHHFQ